MFDQSDASSSVNGLDVIYDWDSGDVIRGCYEQDQVFFDVQKIDYATLDGVYTGTNSANDVIIRLTNGQVIYVLNAAYDFQAGERDLMTGIFTPFNPGDGKSNADDFQFFAADSLECTIECPSPSADTPLDRFDFCDDEAVMVP